jgi:hypothetical protein
VISVGSCSCESAGDDGLPDEIEDMVYSLEDPAPWRQHSPHRIHHEDDAPGLLLETREWLLLHLGFATFEPYVRGCPGMRRLLDHTSGNGTVDGNDGLPGT